jgi:hypothetical protein
MSKHSKSGQIISVAVAFAALLVPWRGAVWALPAPAPESLPECNGCITPKAGRTPATPQEAPPLCESCISHAREVTPTTRSDFPE